MVNVSPKSAANEKGKIEVRKSGMRNMNHAPLAWMVSSLLRGGEYPLFDNAVPGFPYSLHSWSLPLVIVSPQASENSGVQNAVAAKQVSCYLTYCKFNLTTSGDQNAYRGRRDLTRDQHLC